MRYLSALAGIVLGLVPCAISAQTAPAEWVRNCENNTCSLTREMTDANTGKRAATFFVVIEKDLDTTRIGTALPLGIALEPGIRFDAAGALFDLPIEVCFPDGCRAQREFNTGEISAITKAEAIKIQFFPYGSEAPVFMTMPLTGLSYALGAARAELN